MANHPSIRRLGILGGICCRLGPHSLPASPFILETCPHVFSRFSYITCALQNDLGLVNEIKWTSLEDRICVSCMFNLRISHFLLELMFFKVFPSLATWLALFHLPRKNIHFSTKGWPETCCTSHMVFCIPTGKIEGYLLMKSFPHLWDETVSKCLIFLGGRGSKIRLSIIPTPPPKHKLTSTFNFRTSTVYICTNRPLEHFLFVVNPNESWV